MNITGFAPALARLASRFWNPLQAPPELWARMVSVLQLIVAVVEEFRKQRREPEAALHFEEKVQGLLRELGRQIVEYWYNNLEPDSRAELPPKVYFNGSIYRCGERSRRRGGLLTLFGAIEFNRFLYPLYDTLGAGIFPLELQLGIGAAGATVALLKRMGKLIATHTQEQTREFLRQVHGVHLSVTRLRKCVASLAVGMAQHRHAAQLGLLLGYLRQAQKSCGKYRIVLAIGRDGVFIPIRMHDGYQEAATATITVYDRAKRRVGTVYLGHTPEEGQVTLSAELTRLILDVLAGWDGPLPRLCYVTDAGHHPTDYFAQTLRPMCHPRTKEPLMWEWVLDYYHVAGYISKMSEALFGSGLKALAWAHKMRHWLLEKNRGVFRVLHSAVALKHRHGLCGGADAAEAFRKAYNYLEAHLAYTNYPQLRQDGLPIGSGVTEAACKTVFTCRFKQSGMKWDVPTAQHILELRLAHLSHTYDDAFSAYLAAQPQLTATNTEKTDPLCKIAA